MFVSLLALCSTAQAAFPDDVTLTQMATWDGSAVTQTSIMAETYNEVIFDLAATVANKPMAPAETLGANGFDISLSSAFGLISTKLGEDDEPSAWHRVHVDGDPSPVLWIPQINIRKGLPLSLEVGTNLGYVGFSRQATFGAYGRAAIVEGYRKAPDFTVQVGYAGYVGNDELELGVMDASATLGYTARFGTLVGINTSTISPYGGVGILKIDAYPKLSTDQMEALGIQAVSGFKGDDYWAKGYTPVTLNVGFQIKTGSFKTVVSSAITPKALATINVGMGMNF